MPTVRPLLLFLLALGLSGCGGTYLRVTTSSGRTYYCKQGEVVHGKPAGYVVFKDLATGKKVRVPENEYMSEKVSRGTVFSHQVDSALYKGQERDEQQMRR